MHLKFRDEVEAPGFWGKNEVARSKVTHYHGVVFGNQQNFNVRKWVMTIKPLYCVDFAFLFLDLILGGEHK